MARHRPAFTLIELLVVASVFSLLFLIAATVFASIQVRQRDVLVRQRLTADGRYALESMARTLRLDRIDYAYYYASAGLEGMNHFTGPALPTTILVTRSTNNAQTCYRKSGSVLQVGQNCGGTATWTSLTPGDLNILAFNVWITPASNPFLARPSLTQDCRQDTSTPFDSATGACDCSDLPGPVANQNKCFPGQRCLSTGSSSTPAYTCQNSTQQPTVTIKLTTESNSGPNKTQVILQTTVSTRGYGA